MDEEVGAVVQGREGNAAKRAVGHDDEGVDGVRGEEGLERAHQPVVELLRVRPVLVRAALLEEPPERARARLERRRGYRHAHLLDLVPGAHQQVEASREDHGVDHGRARRQGLEAAHPRAQPRHALVLEVVLQLDGLHLLDGRARFEQALAPDGRIAFAVRGPQQQVRIAGERRADRVAVGLAGQAQLDEQVVAEGAQARVGAPVVRERRPVVSPRLGEPRGLPFPAEEEVRRLGGLGGEDGLARGLERRLAAARLLRLFGEHAEGLRAQAQVARRIRVPEGFLEDRLAARRERRAQPRGGARQQHRLLGRIRHGRHERERPVHGFPRRRGVAAAARGIRRVEIRAGRERRLSRGARKRGAARERRDRLRVPSAPGLDEAQLVECGGVPRIGSAGLRLVDPLPEEGAGSIRIAGREQLPRLARSLRQRGRRRRGHQLRAREVVGAPGEADGQGRQCGVNGEGKRAGAHQNLATNPIRKWMPRSCSVSSPGGALCRGNAL